jgi:tRNA (Thr-GGU) A37 N-methylase
VLQVHPRDDLAVPLTGVFATRCRIDQTRSGCRLTVREIFGTRLRVGPIEAVDSTPVVDVKAVLEHCSDH